MIRHALTAQCCQLLPGISPVNTCQSSVAPGCQTLYHKRQECGETEALANTVLDVPIARAPGDEEHLWKDGKAGIK
jgi:hypothetical protein